MENAHFVFKPWTARAVSFSEESYVRRRRLVFAFLCIATSGLGVLLMLLQAANMSGVEIGSGLQIFVDSLKYTLGKTDELKESALYLRGFLLPLLVFLAFFVIFPFGKGVLSLISSESERKAGIVAWFAALGKLLIVVAYLIYVAGLSRYYDLSSFVLYAFPLCLVPDIVIFVMDFLYLKGSSSLGEEEQVVRMTRIFKKEWVCDAFYSFLLPLLFLSFLLLPLEYNPVFDYSSLASAKAGVDQMADNVGRWGNEVKISLDKKQEKIIELSPRSPLTWSEMGNNYLYCQTKIAELRKERNALLPNTDADNPEDALREYTEAMAKMDEDIKALSALLDSLPTNRTDVYMEKTEVNDYVFSRIKEIAYNANSKYADEEGRKWGVDKGGYAKTVFVKESIFLQLISSEPTVTTKTDYFGTVTTTAMATFDDTLPFTTETDFSEDLIRATVRYGDGSYKIGFITVKNAEELNKASSGWHTLKWEDAWGEYSAEIYISQAK